MFDADLEQIEVEPPLENWCASGHQAPATFRREGPGTPDLPTRFFLVKGHNVHGIYCEPCLAIANHIARLKKQGKIER